MSLCLVVVSCNFKSWGIMLDEENSFFQAIWKNQIKMLNIRLCCTVVNKEFSKEVDLDAEEGRSSLPPCLVFSSIVSAVRLILQCANFACQRRSNVQRYIFCLCANSEILHPLQLQIKSQPIVWASYSAFSPIYTLPNSFAPATDVLFTDPLDSEPVFVF